MAAVIAAIAAMAVTETTPPPTAPHVIYQTGKGPDEPCSITSSLNYFPEDEPGETNVTAPPRAAPSNLTVVTVEGCPSFIILDWEKTDNDTTGRKMPGGHTPSDM